LTARLAERFADPDDGRGPARAGLDLSAAWVGTFHSLCGRIAREHPFAAGVDPGFAELDEAEAGALAEEALDEALEDTEAAGFDELLAGVAQIDEVRAAALVAHERLRAAGHEAPRLRVPAAGDPGALDALDAALRSAAAALEAHPRASEQHRRAV